MYRIKIADDNTFYIENKLGEVKPVVLGADVNGNVFWNFDRAVEATEED